MTVALIGGSRFHEAAGHVDAAANGGDGLADHTGGVGDGAKNGTESHAGGSHEVSTTLSRTKLSKQAGGTVLKGGLYLCILGHRGGICILGVPHVHNPADRR